MNPSSLTAIEQGALSPRRPFPPLARLSRREHQTLLNCIAGIKPVPDRLRWKRLVEAAGRHRVASLVAPCLEDLELPEAARRRLEEFIAKTDKRTSQAYQGVQALLCESQRRNLTLLIFKGPVLCEMLYDRPEQRSFFDLDLLVKKADLEKTEQLLIDSGYELRLLRTSSRRWIAGTHDPNPIGTGDLLSREETRELYLAHHFHLPYVPKEAGKGLRIDLHWSLFPEANLSLPLEEFWQRAEPITLAGQTTLTFCPVDNLLYLCLHTALDGYARIRLLKLLDILRLAEKFSLPEWQDFATRAEKYQVEKLAGLGLWLAYHAFHQEVPEAARELVKTSFRQRLLAALLSDPAILTGNSPAAEASWNWYLGQPGTTALYKLLRAAARRIKHRGRKNAHSLP
jgi:hypothetical protein